MSFKKFKTGSSSDNLSAEKPADKTNESSNDSFLNKPVIRPTASAVTISKGTRISGSLVFETPAFLDAEIEGELIASQRLELGPQSIVKAKVSGTEIVVAGQLSGDVIASKRLVLKAGARLIGNVQTASFSLEEGAIFEGYCSMKSAPEMNSGDGSGSAKVTTLPTSGTRVRAS